MTHRWHLPGLIASMIVRLAVRLVVLAVIIGLVAQFVPGIHVQGSFVSLLWIALIFSVFSWLAELLFPATRRAKHSRSAQAAHDPA
jgi:hypothetical protein